jgi:hypothetical protein
MPEVTIKFDYSPGDKVTVDGNGAGIVTGLCFETDRKTYRVEWFANGVRQEVWLDGWRLGRE